MNGRAGKPDRRGNHSDRHRSKLWLLSPEAGFGGDGIMVKCVHGCGTTLTLNTVQRDRIVPGSQGGRYVRSNLQPACRPCNTARSDNTDWSLA